MIPTASERTIARWEASLGGLTEWQRRERGKAARSMAEAAAPAFLSEVDAETVTAWLSRCSRRNQQVWRAYAIELCAWMRTNGVRRDDPAATLAPVLPTRTKAAPGSLEHLAHAWLREGRVSKGLKDKTLSMRRGILLAFVDTCGSPDPAKLTKRDVVRWLATTEHLAANTRRLYFSTAHLWVRWLVEEGHLRRDPFRTLQPPAEERPPHRALDPEQIRALLDACVDERERVIVLLGVHTGLRRAELAALTTADVSLASRSLLVRKGKGGHARTVPLSEEACDAVRDYMAAAMVTAGPLLRSRRSPHLGICPATVAEVFRRLATRSGVKVAPGDGVATHALRHTLATELYNEGGDIMVVRDFLGHSLLNTTQRYVRGMTTERMRAAVEGRSYLSPVVR